MMSNSKSMDALKLWMKTEDSKFASKFSHILTLALFLASFYCPIPAEAATMREIVFPVIGEVRYYNDFGNPRVGHTHEGNDLMGYKMQPLVSAVNGTIILLTPPGSWGYNLTIKDDLGYTYHYIHLNNDTPGTDDGRGGYKYAYAPEIKFGGRVFAGQLIGWMGDSGNAEGTGSHLHFEIRKNGRPFSPYHSLQKAKKISSPTQSSALPDIIITAARTDNLVLIPKTQSSTRLKYMAYTVNLPKAPPIPTEEQTNPQLLPWWREIALNHK